MKLSQAKEFLPLVQAAADGKVVQLKSYDGTWIDLVGEAGSPDFSEPPESYRIKPTPKLRPWKPEEGVGKIVRIKGSAGICLLLEWNPSRGGFWFTIQCEYKDGEWLLENCEQLDGTPCGVEE